MTLRRGLFSLDEHEGRVVLTPTLEPTPYLENIMRDAEADYKAGRNVTKTKTTAEALAHLRSL